jgi:ferric-dicitrate binding protein FerR (iron transport regulator)
MSNCNEYKDLFEKYLDGTIRDRQLAELKTHTDTCQRCREEFDRCVHLQQVIRQAFSPRMAADHARVSLLARLPVGPNQQVRPAQYGVAWLAGRRTAIAAGILLAIGLLLGFTFGRMSSVKPASAPLPAQVPMQVANLEGTVLVRHKGSDVWQMLEAGSKIYLGDTFHSAAKSGFVLQLHDESTINVNQNSMLVLKSYNGETQFYLEHGELTAALESPHSPFFISTPHGRVEALGTEFTVTVE